MEPNIEKIGDLSLQIILTKLGPKETAKLCCINKRFKNSATDEALWSKFCSQDLLLSSPLDPHGNPSPSFFSAYRSWRLSFASYPFHLIKRVIPLFKRLNLWVSSNFPQIEKTLNRGATEDEILGFEKKLGVKLPVTTRLVYRFFDGQDVRLKRDENSSDDDVVYLLGLIGGYLFYDHLVNVYLLPLRDMLARTWEIRFLLRSIGLLSKANRFVVVAASITKVEKLFLLDCTSGEMFVCTRNLLSDWEMIPCVPRSEVSNRQDGMLLWLEEHVRRLENGIVKVREEEKLRFLCQFPENSELCSSAVTNGVKVRASAVFVPELANLQSTSREYYFAYSIRLSLLPEGCMINGVYFESCQLHKRHWLIYADGAVVDDVHGEAVIGKFPLLLPGEEEFVYESCTPLPTPSGSVKGSFTFSPGSLAEPKGGPFEVDVAEFLLQLPEYIF